MTAKSQTTREKVVAQLKALTAYRDHTITDDTEIYYDLRIFGHDLYDFFVWVSGEFGVPVDLHPNEHGPREGMPPLLFRNWRDRRERMKRPYKRLTVGDVIGLIERGRQRD